MLDGDADERSLVESLLGKGKQTKSVAGDAAKMPDLVETPEFPPFRAADYHHLPCTSVLRKPLPQGGLSNPDSLINYVSAAHTETCALNAVRVHTIIASSFDTSMAMVAKMRNPFGLDNNLGEPADESVSEPSVVIGPRGQWERRKGSVAASIRSANEILWRDAKVRSTPVPTPLPTPHESRRSSAWAVGKGSLGLTIDPWGGKVTGK